MGYKIAIDGPSASGKGFLAKEIAEKLHITYIDTGAMYRAFAFYALENNIDIEVNKEVEKALLNCKITFEFEENKMRVFLNDKDISDKIRTEKIGMQASKVSAIKKVREDMVKRQREMGSVENVVMEGRDIGSVVFKEAEVKIYLDADVSVRAKRRLQDLLLKNKEMTFEKVLEDLKKRDISDINKKISPLVKTKDHILLDTTNLNKDEVLIKALKIIKIKGINVDGLV